MRRVLLALTTMTLVLAGAPVGAAQEGRWLPALPPEQVSLTTLSMLDDGTGFAVRPAADVPGTVVLRTGDGGVTWSLVGRAAQLGPSSRARFASGEVGYAADGSLYRSGDGGQTWAGLDGPLPADEAVRPVTYRDVAVAGNAVATGGPVDRRPQDCGETPPDDNTTVLGVSLDGAQTWAVAELPFWGAVRRVDVGPDGSGAALVAVVDETSAPGPVLPQASCLTASRTRFADHVWAFDLVSGDVAARRVLDCEPVVCTAVARPTPDRIVVGMGDGTLRISDDGGATFEAVALTQGVTVLGNVVLAAEVAVAALAFADTDTAFAQTHGAGLYRSDDGGRTWTEELSPQRQGFGLGNADLAVNAAGAGLASGQLGVLRRDIGS